MTEEINKDVVMYSYYGSDGKKYWTSNLEFARSRASFHGSEDVYIETTKN
jgi:hypothetical protein